MGSTSGKATNDSCFLICQPSATFAEGDVNERLRDSRKERESV